MGSVAFANRPPGPPRYPWDRWLASNNHFTLRRGVDFHCRVYAMGIQVREAAARRGLKVSLTVIDGDRDGHDDTIVARVTDRSGEHESRREPRKR